jgi:hypothetical protein
MHIDNTDFLFHELTSKQADDLFVLAQREVFSKTVFEDQNELVVDWIKVAGMADCPASFHLTFPSRALISIAAHYKSRLVNTEKLIFNLGKS